MDNDDEWGDLEEKGKKELEKVKKKKGQVIDGFCLILVLIFVDTTSSTEEVPLRPVVKKGKEKQKQTKKGTDKPKVC